MQGKTQRPHFSMAPFTALVFLATVTMLGACFFAPRPVQVAVIGIYATAMVGLVLHATTSTLAGVLNRIEIPLGLAPEHELFEFYRALVAGLTELAGQTDPALREFAGRRLETICAELKTLAEGRISFTATETWRKVYEDLLATLNTRTYYSVAWVKSTDYWRDAAGQNSMRLNYDLVARGYRIERVVILPDTLWPPGQRLPTGDVAAWMREQHERGIVLRLARESDLASEPDLLCDLGIYGDRAIGRQRLSEGARTQEFELRFDPASLRQAMQQWLRLQVYTISLAVFLDREDAG